MTTQSPDIEYTRRLELRRAALARAEIKNRRLGIFRLAVFTAAVVLAWFVLFRAGTLSPLWLLAPGVAFVLLLVIHSRVVAESVRMRRAVAFYERGLSRLQGHWQGTGNGGERYSDSSHPYAQDLDLFGKNSLFELLCSARTRGGEEMLANWLRIGTSGPEIRSRQAAVRELCPKLDLREDLAVLGDDIGSAVDTNALSNWGSSPPMLNPWPSRAAAAVISILTVLSLLVWGIAGNHRWFLAMILVEAAFTFWMRSGIRGVVKTVERSGPDLQLLAAVLARLERETFSTIRLAGLRAALGTTGPPASRRISKLNRLIVLLDSRKNPLFAPVAALLLWEIHIAYAVESWRRKTGPAIAGWLQAIAEFEALSALGGYSYENPEDPFPEICEGPRCYEGEGLGHPLIARKKCVRNSVHLSEALQVLIVSGSNMSGKSTLLRTIGINAVLAQAGAPVRAKSLRLSPLVIGASIRLLDSLQEGTSRFYAEITRLRKLVDLAEGPVPLLFLLDELLHGTNSHDRRIGAEAVVRGLVRRGAIGLLTTHDLALSRIVDEFAPRAANVHFEDSVADGKIIFDYRLRAGVVQKSNAIELMRSIGLEV